jgi:hypothetical protein
VIAELRELLRLVASTAKYGLRRPLVLVVVVVVAAVAILSATVTVGGPVALYPFL